MEKTKKFIEETKIIDSFIKEDTKKDISDDVLKYSEYLAEKQLEKINNNYQIIDNIDRGYIINGNNRIYPIASRLPYVSQEAHNPPWGVGVSGTSGTSRYARIPDGTVGDARCGVNVVPCNVNSSQMPMPYGGRRFTVPLVTENKESILKKISKKWSDL